MKLRLMICAAAASTALFATDVTSAATYAVMNVTNAYTDTVIAVPWVGLDGDPILVSNLVNSTTLSDGDMLYMYDNVSSNWYGYTKVDGAWQGYTTVTEAKITIGAADAQTAARGTGLIIQRASGSPSTNILLCGRVGTGDVTTTIATGKTLFANPTATAVDINTKFTGALGATNGDTISIPLNNGGTDQYTFDGTKSEWGKVTYTEITLANGRKRKTQAWSKCGSIPAGTGAWYETTGSGYTVTW